MTLTQSRFLQASYTSANSFLITKKTNRNHTLNFMYADFFKKKDSNIHFVRIELLNLNLDVRIVTKFLMKFRNCCHRGFKKKLRGFKNIKSPLSKVGRVLYNMPLMTDKLEDSQCMLEYGIAK